MENIVITSELMKNYYEHDGAQKEGDLFWHYTKSLLFAKHSKYRES